MATINKYVKDNETAVVGSEPFIYVYEVNYAGLSDPTATGSATDFFPDYIEYSLPPLSGSIVNITETPSTSPDGTIVTFDFGTVTAGTSFTFEVACNFGPGRVDGQQFENFVEILENDIVVNNSTADIVTLSLIDGFYIFKSANQYTNLVAGQTVTMWLNLYNYENEPNEQTGYVINNVVLTDVLPAGFSPDLSFTPVGSEVVQGGYSDPTYNGLTGSWSGNTLIFNLPQYSGPWYRVEFQVIVDDDVTPGQSITNTGSWTEDGTPRGDNSQQFTIFQPIARGTLTKSAPDYATLDSEINYITTLRNSGTVDLIDVTFYDDLPPEVDLTLFRTSINSSIAPTYDIYLISSDAPTTPKPVDLGISGNSPLYNVSDYIPVGARVLRIYIFMPLMVANNFTGYMYLRGMINDTANINDIVTNTAGYTADSELGPAENEITVNTLINGESTLNIQKSPDLGIYYPLNEFRIKLTRNGGLFNSDIVVDPIFADLLPVQLAIIPNMYYVEYTDGITGVSYDSRQPGFPVPIPTETIIDNYMATGRTLVRYNFNNYTLPFRATLSVVFTAFVKINAGSEFENEGFLGNPGDNTNVINGQNYPDTLDIDGDNITNEEIATDIASGVILTTSEFSLMKWVKGEGELDFTQDAQTFSGGDVEYLLNITNNQETQLTNIELVDILPHPGDTGVILTADPRGSQFFVYPTAMITAQIVNLLDNTVVPNPDITIEYSLSSDPVRFDITGTTTIGTGTWSTTAPTDVTTIRSIKITTGPSVILNPYDRLIVSVKGTTPTGVPINQIAYNSFAVRGEIVMIGGSEPLLPTEPNKVSVRIVGQQGSSIGDYVWYDMNGDGIYDPATEPGVNGIIVELYDGNGTLLGQTITANNTLGEPGFYSFGGLVAGDYYLKFIPTGDFLLTVSQPTLPNGSKPDQTSGLTATIALGDNEAVTDMDAGVLIQCDPPVINAENKCVYQGEPFDPLSGVTATDCLGNDISADVIVIFNDVNIDEPGLYVVTYLVTDFQGQSTAKSIYVKVLVYSPHHDAITDIIQSVALEQASLAHILNAEGEKIQRVVSEEKDMAKVIAVNNGVMDTIHSIALLETILKSKLGVFNDCLVDCCIFPDEDPPINV